MAGREIGDNALSLAYLERITIPTRTSYGRMSTIARKKGRQIFVFSIHLHVGAFLYISLLRRRDAPAYDFASERDELLHTAT